LVEEGGMRNYSVAGASMRFYELISSLTVMREVASSDGGGILMLA
jgi:hypothetical protein